MKTAGSAFLLLALFFSLACSTSTTSSANPVVPPDFDMHEIQQDIRTGKLRFEVRGLANESQEKSYGGKSFQHTAVVIPVGDSKYTKGDFLLMCSVKTVSGGDPENSRKSDDVTAVYIHDGMGRLSESGGYKGKDEKWEPEKIEVRPQVVFVGTPVTAAAVQE